MLEYSGRLLGKYQLEHARLESLDQRNIMNTVLPSIDKIRQIPSPFFLSPLTIYSINNGADVLVQAQVDTSDKSVEHPFAVNKQHREVVFNKFFRPRIGVNQDTWAVNEHNQLRDELVNRGLFKNLNNNDLEMEAVWYCKALGSRIIEGIYKSSDSVAKISLDRVLQMDAADIKVDDLYKTCLGIAAVIRWFGPEREDGFPGFNTDTVRAIITEMVHIGVFLEQFFSINPAERVGRVNKPMNTMPVVNMEYPWLSPQYEAVFDDGVARRMLVVAKRSQKIRDGRDEAARRTMGLTAMMYNDPVIHNILLRAIAFPVYSMNNEQTPASIDAVADTHLPVSFLAASLPVGWKISKSVITDNDGVVNLIVGMITAMDGIGDSFATLPGRSSAFRQRFAKNADYQLTSLLTH